MTDHEAVSHANVVDRASRRPHLVGQRRRAAAAARIRRRRRGRRQRSHVDAHRHRACRRLRDRRRCERNDRRSVRVGAAAVRQLAIRGQLRHAAVRPDRAASQRAVVGFDRRPQTADEPAARRIRHRPDDSGAARGLRDHDRHAGEGHHAGKPHREWLSPPVRLVGWADRGCRSRDRARAARRGRASGASDVLSVPRRAPRQPHLPRRRHGPVAVQVIEVASRSPRPCRCPSRTARAAPSARTV